MNIHWYPGHMAKARRLMQEELSAVDCVIELLDARIPYSSKNPDIDQLAANKIRVIALNKADLAQEAQTMKWKEYYERKGFTVALINSTTGKGFPGMVAEIEKCMEEKKQRQKARGRLFVPTKSLVAGIPNVGKSTFINQCVGKSMAKTGDRPGVTKNKQWIRIKKEFLLLDTPGILWPKFEDPWVGKALAFTGAIKDEIMDMETLGLNFVQWCMENQPDRLITRYSIAIEGTPIDVLKKIGLARSLVKKGGEADLERTAKVILDELRGGKLGRITLENPSAPD